MRTSHYHLIN